MGGLMLRTTSEVEITNKIAFDNITRLLKKSVRKINKKLTKINLKSDVFERGTMSMAGIKVTDTYPASTSFFYSMEEADSMNIKIKAM